MTEPWTFVKTGDKLHDFLMNPKSRPDLQTPGGQHFLRSIEQFHNEKTDPLMPWLAREYKKGRLHNTQSLDHQLKRHPVGRALPDELKWALQAYDRGKPYDGVVVPALHKELSGGDTPNFFYDRPDAHREYLSPGTLSHWGDFMRSNHPLRRSMGDIMQHQLPAFHDRVDAWTQAMRDEAKAKELEGGLVVHRTPDNWTVRQLTTPEELEAEGDAMGHCVGGYHQQVQNGDSLIYSLRDPQGFPHATTEITPNQYGWPHNGHVVQIQGKSDEVPIPEYQQRLKHWFQSFPDNERPKWADEPGDIEHIGGIMPNAESYDSSIDEMVNGEPREDGMGGGYGPHGDYGLVSPHRPINYHSVIDSLIRPKSYNEWSSHRHGNDTYPMDYDPSEVEGLYQEALRRKEIPQLADAVLSHGERTDEEFNDQEVDAMDYDPHFPHYPGESWDEEPERWQDIVDQETTNPDVYSPYHGVESPEQAFDITRQMHEDTVKGLYNNHVPSQLSSALHAKINPHWGAGPGGIQGWQDQPQTPQTPETGTFSSWDI